MASCLTPKYGLGLENTCFTLIIFQQDIDQKDLNRQGFVDFQYLIVCWRIVLDRIDVPVQMENSRNQLIDRQRCWNTFVSAVQKKPIENTIDLIFFVERKIYTTWAIRE